MMTISSEVVKTCKNTLITTKQDLLNRVKSSRRDLYSGENSKGGDEGDQTLRVLAESEFLSMNERFRNQLVEIEMALSRIERGVFGICEETEESIETERLLAIPWTRLSIEGAEIRESLLKRYVK